MKTRRSARVIFVALLPLAGIVGLAFPESALAGDNDPRPSITVQIYNYSQASPSVLVEAEREAGRILGEAGLRAVWLECLVAPSTPGPHEPYKKAPEATDLRLRVLAAPVQNKFRHPDLQGN